MNMTLMELKSIVRLLLFIVLYIEFIEATICPVPPPCNCTQYSGARAYCNNRNLTKIPTIIKSGGTWIIDFSNNYIQTVEAGVFKNIQLEQVYFSNNSITKIDDEAFAGSENSMDVLRLDGNQLDSIPKCVTKFVGLIGLNIQYNPLKVLDEGILSNLSSSFSGISFGSKEMTSWPVSLKSLKGLLMISVYGLPMDNIPEDAFSGFESTLSFLEIYSTDIRIIPNSINKLTNLQYFTLTDNMLITTIPEDAFRGLNNLSTLTLENNGLKEIPAIFKDSSKMYQTFIRGNPIVSLSDSQYRARNQSQFHYLTLTNTQFPAVPTSLSDMEQVWVIDLSHGQIKSIKAQDFRNLPSLANLIFTSNPISIVDDGAHADLPSLKYLSLDNTNLTSVPKAVRNTNVSWVNLNNTAVFCTCKTLGWMKAWPGRLQTTFVGSCHNSRETIMNFILKALPNC